MGHCTPAEPPPAADATVAVVDEPARSQPSTTVEVPPPPPRPRTAITATVGVVAATYRGPLFDGDYQGVSVGAGASRGRFAGSVAITEYQLNRNGRSSLGVGDVLLHLHARIVTHGALAVGAMVMGSIPTGDGDRGFGMGHVMLMSEAWVSWSRSPHSLEGSGGFGYAAGGAAAHAEHGGGGAWPIVDPMNAREITYQGSATYSLARALGVGARVVGAMPVGDGVSRTALAGRVLWTAGRVVTTLEVAGGIAGDPFGVRGTLGAMIRLR